MKTPQEIIAGQRKKVVVHGADKSSAEIAKEMAEGIRESRPKKKGKPFHGMSPAARDNKMAVKGRLPDKSRFEVQYDAERQVWVGELYIHGQTLFKGERSGVFALLAHLNDEWRQFKVLQENPK